MKLRTIAATTALAGMLALTACTSNPSPQNINTRPSAAVTKAAVAAPASQAPVAAPTAAPASPTRTPIPTQSFSGSSDDVKTVDLQGQPAIITFDCPACTGNTVLKTNGEDSLLVNAIGAYGGAHLIDTDTGSVTSQLDVTANAPWTLTVSDISTITPVSGKVDGHGDTVVLLSGATTAATITNTGASNFVVRGFGGSSPELAVNTIGGYSGTVPLTGPGFVQVMSDGDWSIAPQ